MLKHLCCCAALSAFFPVATIAMAAETSPTSAPAPIEKLSPAALEALVSGVALYPDPLVEQILLAAQDPLALHQAAEAQNGTLPPEVAALAGKSTNESVQHLTQYPEVLTQLDAQLALTTRLGVAVRTQPEDVWTAISNVRAAYEASLTEPVADEATESSGGSSSSTGAYPVYGGWLSRRLLTAGAVHELNEYRYDQYVAPYANAAAGTTQTTYVGPNGQTATATTTGGGVAYDNGVTSAKAGAGTTTVVGPNGQTATVTGAAAGGKTTVGNTTYAGVKGAGTVTGPNGESVSAAGGAKGSATQTENGVQVQTQAGGAYSTSTGAEGYGVRSGSTSATQNADGSTSWNRTTSGSGAGTNGSGSYTHSGSGTAKGDGTGSYQGETTVNANGNSVSTDTTAGGGQASTTVTNNNTGASNTYTAGDGQVENAPATTADSRGASSAKEGSAAGSRDWSQMSRDQISQANQALKQSWGQLGSQVRGGTNAKATSARTTGANAAKNKNLTSGANKANANRATTRSTPQRNTPTRSNGARPSGGGRGGRGGRR